MNEYNSRVIKPNKNYEQRLSEALDAHNYPEVVRVRRLMANDDLMRMRDYERRFKDSNSEE